ERMRLGYAVPALEWLLRQPAPVIIAPAGDPSDVKYRLYVPDNVGDRVAKSWRGGNTSASIADYRTEKDVRPTHLTGDAVHYLYPIADEAEFAKHGGTLGAAARSVTHLGWGIDMVAADAEVITESDADKRPGHRWRVVLTGGAPLRVPKPGTLDDLIRKHAD